MKILLVIILGLTILTTVGCKKTEIVYVSMSKPSSVEGSLIVIDKRKIKVFNAKTKSYMYMKVQGLHLIHKVDLETLYLAYKNKK